MTEYDLHPFKLIHKHNGEPVTRSEIQQMALDKGFFENEFKSFQIMLKENGTPVVFGFNPLTHFSLNREDYSLKWIY
jgi:hypothetical protein